MTFKRTGTGDEGRYGVTGESDEDWGRSDKETGYEGRLGDSGAMDFKDFIFESS